MTQSYAQAPTLLVYRGDLSGADKKQVPPAWGHLLNRHDRASSWWSGGIEQVCWRTSEHGLLADAGEHRRNRVSVMRSSDRSQPTGSACISADIARCAAAELSPSVMK